MVDTAAEAVAEADVVITMVFDAEAVIDVAEHAIGAARPGTVWLQMATIGLDGVRRAAELAAGTPVRFVDAPVLGSKRPAEDGALVPLVAGPPEAIEAAQPVLDAVGSHTIVAGTEPGAAMSLKLIVNTWNGALTAGTAQAVAMCAALDIPVDTFLRAISGGILDAPVAHQKARKMVRRDFGAEFEVSGLAKDLALAEHAVAPAGVQTQLLDALRSVFDGAASRGHRLDDIAAVLTSFEPPEADNG